ncbi:hypothetical protein [Christiangramia sediminis]|uniref:Uncharacterized protein n=1 Tax=Christiangramia sediminis TaxID=2881336 RepID=A0A9X1LGD3_9FLAO|nr:hypothetical protein [Christiangramia sediminis]MCB7479866.1 hypothetical protein [Christiangramia sediminis]
MPKLLVKRNSEWANKMRSFDLYLNGRKFAEIKDKQVLSFEIPEGKYQLMAKIDWCGSQPLDIEISEGEIKRIEVKGFIFSKYLLPVAVVSGFLYFGIYFKYNTNSLFLATLLMIFFGYMLYFMSFGRNQYLRLREI